MFRIAVTSLAALAGLLPAIASAQTSASGTEPNARQVHAIAACLVRTNARGAAAFLSISPIEPQARVLRELGTALGDCAADAGGEGQQLRLTAAALRGPVAEAFFERDFNGWAARSGRRPVAVYVVTPPPAQVPRARMLADMAACVADARPGEILALLAANPASAAESRAMSALVPALGPCFRAGQTADVTPAALRGLLAEAAYRRAVASAAPRPTSG